MRSTKLSISLANCLRYFQMTHNTVVLRCSAAGIIEEHTPLAQKVLASRDALIGRPLADFVCQADHSPLALPTIAEAEDFLSLALLATHSEKVLHGLLLPEGDGTVLVADVVGESDDVAEQIGVLANEISNISRDLRQRNRELEEANRRITELSRTDALTGLANRRCFLERLTPALSVVARHEVDVSIIMADLDHFKNVNDTYGHEEGDRVLRAFADVLRAECRKEDLPGRFGGEEFIILLPHTVPSRGATVAERIRTRFANETSARCRAACTASFGVAAVTAQDTAESAIARADKALYAAKETGRNRTVVG